jgi:hypothetical protein
MTIAAAGTIFVAAHLAIGACALACGDDQRTSPTGQSPSTVAQPVSSGDVKVDAILDRLEVKGEAIKGLKADLVYQYVTVEPFESAQTKKGVLRFARGEPNAKFYVHFDQLIADGVARATGEYFVFDGRWLVERNDRSRSIIRRQIAREGEHIDPFKIGEGPFPLPFGQRRNDILREFDVRLEKLDVGDPPGSDHLKCVPRPNTELAARYSRVEIFVDRRLELPVRIVTERVRDGNRIEVDFKKIDVNEAPAGSWFDIEEPEDFVVTVEPLTATARGPEGGAP